VIDDVHAEIAARLAALDQRYTRIRRAIVDALRAGGAPYTLPEVLAVDRSLSQSSTYRNLAVLEEAGAVRRVVHGTGDHARYELAEELTEHHHHLICTTCGSVSDVTFDAELETELDRAFHGAAAASGFRPAHHAIDIYGACSRCL
jgi:Fur family ferric uptake transcriptional regulator